MYQLNEKIVTFLPPEAIEPQAKSQLENISEMPFVFHHVAVMPDCHLGKGATGGSVIATKGAIIPAAVGVDIGCGMIAVKTKFFAKDLPDNLEKVGQASNAEFRSVPEHSIASLRKQSKSGSRNLETKQGKITRTSIKGGQRRLVRWGQ